MVVFTNLFRDQLDRYGEVESIATLWRQAAASLAPSTTLVLNADDPSVAALRHVARGPVLAFGIADPSVGTEHEEHPADARWCGRCGREFAYTTRFFWHVGHWRCPGCGDERPEPDVAAAALAAEAEIEIAVQVNGKVRDRIEVPAGIDEAEAERLALASPRVRELLDGATPKKVVVRPPRLVNVVV
ncbi:MAG: hypothetical protein C4321_10280 [Chloroflexota bacterium]